MFQAAKPVVTACVQHYTTLLAEEVTWHCVFIPRTVDVQLLLLKYYPISQTRWKWSEESVAKHGNSVIACRCSVVLCADCVENLGTKQHIQDLCPF